MKGLKSNITKALQVESEVPVDGNSGAKKLKVISKESQNARRRRRPGIGIGEAFKASVIEGNVEMRREVVRAVLIRQKKGFKRPSGRRVKFEDNAAVLIEETGEPLGTEIKGVVAKEIGKRYPKVATIARNVV